MATHNRGIVHLLVRPLGRSAASPAETACRDRRAILAVPAAGFDAEPRKCARCEAKRAKMRAVSARRAERAAESAAAPSPLFAAYVAASDRVRCGDDSPEAAAACEAAEAAYRASLPKPDPVAPGWWNLPVAASMWRGDARDTGA